MLRDGLQNSMSSRSARGINFQLRGDLAVESLSIKSDSSSLRTIDCLDCS